MIQVRELRTDNEISYLLMLTQKHQQEFLPKLSYNTNMVRAYGQSVLDDRTRVGFNVWIAYKDDKPIGYAVGTCSPQFFCDMISANLTLVYVLPEHRGANAYFNLVCAYEDWAERNGALRIIMGVTVADQEAAKSVEKLFPRLGYTWAGANYIKEKF